uniref:DUF38 domain-containing protein n=1 Tax=Acrobeloides nanus TaxID=290746 RepID=A0A914DUA7_9BILA
MLAETSGTKIMVQKIVGRFESDMYDKCMTDEEHCQELLDNLPSILNELIHTNEAEITFNRYEFYNFLLEPNRWEIVNFPSKTKIQDVTMARDTNAGQIMRFSKSSRFQDLVIEFNSDETFLKDYLMVIN